MEPSEETYQKPPGNVQDVLNAPPSPTPYLNPTRDVIALAQPVGYPAISDLAEPMLRLAGVRINPRNNAERSHPSYWVGLALRKLPDGAEIPVALPDAVRIGDLRWNADGTMLAFTNECADRIELWVVDAASQEARLLPGMGLNPLLGSAMQWMPDQRHLLVRTVPADRGAPPDAPLAPPGPKIQESSKAYAASSTYEVRDVLKGPHDADLFDYYTAAQLVLVDVESGEATPVGRAATYGQVSPAPGGKHLLVERIHRPYSYLRAYHRFPREVEIWTPEGDLLETLASVPLAEQVPIDGVPTGPRSHFWCPIEPATIIWTEALDEGDPKTKVPYRDRVLRRRMDGRAEELRKIEHRFAGLEWIEVGGLALLAEFDRDRRWVRRFIIDTEDLSTPPRLLWDMSADERYGNPGRPVTRVLPTGKGAILRQENWIYLHGMGASPEGDRPFLDRLDLGTLETERLFRSDRDGFEHFVAMVDPVAGRFITRRESPSDPPNFQLRTLEKSDPISAPEGEATRCSDLHPITRLPDPTPQLRDITKRLVTYTRGDGTPLSFTLYLPPGHEEGTRYPTMLWAYPLDYAGGEVAGQVTGSERRFTAINGASPLFFLLQGYAVLMDAAMPVVGPPETVYDTFVEQIVANAQAAIDKAVAMGVTDPERVGVSGHSHGALMTTNLLAHSDLFRAGIARSGAFNHTLRPFGFQNEKRTLYQARDVYVRLSPLIQADKIDKPLLLIHGEIDQNPGTVPMQSEKLYEALRGIGATVRLVMLPHESHGYQAKESVEHVLYEMLAWFDRYVKDA